MGCGCGKKRKSKRAIANARDRASKRRNARKPLVRMKRVPVKNRRTIKKK